MNYKVFIVMAMLSFSFVCHAASMSPESHAMAEPRWLSSQEFKSLSKRNQYKECYAFACNPVNFLGSRLTCLNFILDNLLAKTKIELFNVYLVLAKNPNQKRDFYGNKAFDLAQEMNDAYCICESYIPISLRPGLTQPDIVLKAVSYIYGYFNELGQWNVGHGDYWQKYRILMFALNVNWVKALGDKEQAVERNNYYIKELIKFIEDPNNNIYLIQKYNAYVKALLFFKNPNLFELMHKAYSCAVELNCENKKKEIEGFAKKHGFLLLNNACFIDRTASRRPMPNAPFPFQQDPIIMPSNDISNVTSSAHPIDGSASRRPISKSKLVLQDFKEEPIQEPIKWSHSPYGTPCFAVLPQENE